MVIELSFQNKKNEEKGRAESKDLENIKILNK